MGSDEFGDFGDWVAVVQTAATVVALGFAVLAAKYGRDAVKQAKEADLEAEQERLARLLSECAEVVAKLHNMLGFRSADAKPLQIGLRSLLVGSEGYASLPRTFDLSEAPIETRINDSQPKLWRLQPWTNYARLLSRDTASCGVASPWASS